MDRYGIVSISWRQGGPEALARFAIPRAERLDSLPRLAERIRVSELLYLATCNRVEFVFVGNCATDISEYRRRIVEAMGAGGAVEQFRAWGGEGAVEHLFLVASGLDSARPGETEIADQLRDACDVARRNGLLGRALQLVAEEALRVSAALSRARASGGEPPSLAQIATDRLERRLARTGGPVALIGISAMVERSARDLARRGGVELLVVNRTEQAGAELAAEVGAGLASLASFVERPAPVEAVVTATGATEAILPLATLERLASVTPSGEPPLIVDFAIPPDVDPDVAERAGCQRFGMEEILARAETGRGGSLEKLADARAFVDDALEEFRRKFSERTVTPVIAALQRRYRRTAEEGVDRLFDKELAKLGPGERQAVLDWARTLARRFAHIPSLGLRGLAGEYGTASVEAFLSRLDEALATELRNGVTPVRSPSADERGHPSPDEDRGADRS